MAVAAVVKLIIKPAAFNNSKDYEDDYDVLRTSDSKPIQARETLTLVPEVERDYDKIIVVHCVKSSNKTQQIQVLL